MGIPKSFSGFRSLLESIIIASILLCHWSIPVFAMDKAGALYMEDGQGIRNELYASSHALLIGVSNYTHGWPKLESVPGEIKAIRTVLEDQGFNVHTVSDPTESELVGAFNSFIDRYGFMPNSRLLFFFSGHGYSRKRPAQGYLVPADAPSPIIDRKGFLQKAVSMSQVLTWCREMEAKHVLFMFDSCFSGTIFKSRSLPESPSLSYISSLVNRPVRQFVSAGSAGEEVPEKSVFAPSFIKALKGDGDLDDDGFITGMELGAYLHREVMGYGAGQTPQYGKIKDPDYDEGDFIFKVIHRDKPAFKRKNPPPVIAVGYPRHNDTVTVSRLQMTGTVGDDEGIARMEVFVNGLIADSDLNPVRMDAPAPEKGNLRFSANMPLAAGKNIILVRAFDNEGQSSETSITVFHQPMHSNIYAVVIGINQYLEAPPLAYCRNDASSFVRYLKSNMQVADDNIFELYDSDATLANIRSSFWGKLMSVANMPRATVFIFFAGHGAPGPWRGVDPRFHRTNYLLTHDSKISSLPDTALSVNELSNLFQTIKAGRVIYLSDMYFGGSIDGLNGASGFRGPPSASEINAALSKWKGKVAISGAGQYEASIDDDRLGHGIFSYYLLEGLKGKADYDEDSWIDLDELMQYLKTEVGEATNGKQNPKLKEVTEGSPIVIGKVR